MSLMTTVHCDHPQIENGRVIGSCAAFGPVTRGALPQGWTTVPRGWDVHDPHHRCPAHSAKS